MSSEIPSSISSVNSLANASQVSSNSDEQTQHAAVLDSTSTSQSSQLLTTLSLENPSLTEPRMSIAGFYSVVQQSLDKNKQGIFAALASDPTLTRFLYIFITQLGGSLTDTLNSKIKPIYDEHKAIFDPQNDYTNLFIEWIKSLNEKIDEANNALEEMNQAIQDYNNGLISESQVSAAIMSYNTKANMANSSLIGFNSNVQQYSNKVSQYNQDLAVINQKLAEMGLPAVSPQSMALPSPAPTSYPQFDTSPPFPANPLSALNQNIANVVPLNDTQNLSWYSGIQTTLEPSLVAAAKFSQYSQVWNNMSDFYADFMDYIIGTGKKITLPPSYYTLTLEQKSSSAGGQGISPTGNYSRGLEQPFLNQKVSSATFKDILQYYSRPLNPREFQELQFALYSTLTSVSLLSAGPASGLLSDRLALQDENSLSLNAAIALGLTSNLLAFIEQGGLANTVETVLKQLLGNGFNQELVDPSVKALSVSLLGTSLTALGAALKMPGLAAQVIGNLPGVSADEVTAGLYRPLSAAEVLSNPMSSQSIYNQLEQLTSSQISQAVSQALTKVNNPTDQELRQVLEQQLSQRGLNEIEARSATNVSMSLIQNEDQAKLDTAFPARPAQLDQVNQGLLSSLVARGFPTPDASLIINNALKVEADKRYSSLREFRDDLIAKLASGGLDPSLAITLGAQAASVLLTGSPFNLNAINQGALGVSLQQQLRSQGYSAIDSNGIIASVSSASDEAALRGQIGSALIAQGVSAGAAGNIASGVTVTTNHFQAQSPEEIAGGIRASLDGAVGSQLSRQASINISENLISTLLGPQYASRQTTLDLANPFTVANTLNTQLHATNDRPENEFYQRIKDDLVDSLKPTMDGFAFTQAILDPGKRFVLAETGSITQMHPAATISQTEGLQFRV